MFRIWISIVCVKSNKNIVAPFMSKLEGLTNVIFFFLSYIIFKTACAPLALVGKNRFVHTFLKWYISMSKLEGLTNVNSQKISIF